MKAAVIVAPKRFELRDVPRPIPGPNDVLIRVYRCGICGTDMHIFKGHYAADKLPLVPGHEFAGTVAEVGSGVSRFSIGDPVVADINVGCGHCYFCRRNEILNCPTYRQIGITCDGAFAEFVVVPDRLVIAAPAATPMAILALTEPVACVVRAARKSGASFGQSVAILGAGPIGNLHVQMMRLVGAAPIIVVEPAPGRARMAQEAGADVVVTDPSQAKAVVLAHTEGRGVDLVIESVGLASLYELAFDLIRPGGHIAAFGLTGADATVPLRLLDTVLRENSIKGSVAAMGEDMHDALTLLIHGRFSLGAFTTKTYPLDDIQQAFDDLPKNPDVMKVQIAI